MTPKEIVSELSRYIVGQEDAKKAVAVALRNRYRRSRLSEAEREEITPKNIIMKGPTGVGKTEIARRLAKIVKAPFVKVEATKFTEVGYVGRDVESMVRDLVEVSFRMVKDERVREVRAKAEKRVEKIILSALLVVKRSQYGDMHDSAILAHLQELYRAGTLDDEVIEIALPKVQKPTEIMPGIGEGLEIDWGNMMEQLMPNMGGQPKPRSVSVKIAKAALFDSEADKLIDEDSIDEEALRRAEQDGIIFIDEIDKIASRGGGMGPEVSREGVQRDILPIVEGSTVKTKHGMIKTDYILFIASGAFHISKFSDLIPELQGRFPIVVSLKSLKEEDFVEILTTPDNAILTQYKNLLAVDKVQLSFTDDGILEIAKIAALENSGQEDIGARRLHTVVEQLLDEVAFEADGKKAKKVTIDKKAVRAKFDKVIGTTDLRKYIL